MILRKFLASSALLAGSCALPAILSGCGDVALATTRSTMAPVKGTVTYKGQPLTAGSIAFEPDGGREAHGSIGPDGSFSLTTFEADDGALPGTHRVAIRGAAGKRAKLPLKYGGFASSGIEVEVSPDRSSYAIDLK